MWRRRWGRRRRRRWGRRRSKRWSNSHLDGPLVGVWEGLLADVDLGAGQVPDLLDLGALAGGQVRESGDGARSQGQDFRWRSFVSKTLRIEIINGSDG